MGHREDMGQAWLANDPNVYSCIPVILLLQEEKERRIQELFLNAPPSPTTVASIDLGREGNNIKCRLWLG